MARAAAPARAVALASASAPARAPALAASAGELASAPARTALAPALTLALALAALLGGCCCGRAGFTEDDLPRSKALATPFDTVDFVRFCARAELWGPLYRSLSKETLRNKPFEEKDGIPTALGEALFEVVFPGLTYGDIDDTAPPALADIKVIDMIHGSAITRIGYEPRRPFHGVPRDRQGYAALDYEPVPLERSIFLLVDEGTEDAPRWTLGLYETGQWWHASP